jgi:hypothetical protein
LKAGCLASPLAQPGFILVAVVADDCNLLESRLRGRGIKFRRAGADALGMIRRLLRLPRAHRSVPVKSLRRYSKAICLESQTRA